MIALLKEVLAQGDDVIALARRLINERQRPVRGPSPLPDLGGAGVAHVWTCPDAPIAVYCGDALAALDGLPDAGAGLVLTDPPYSEQTHRGARSRKRRHDPRHPNRRQQKERAMISFAAAGDGFIRSLIEECARVSNAWTLAFLDRRHAALLDVDPPAGAQTIRIGAWIKPNGSPQFTGDRPAEGQERIGIFHRDGARLGRRGDRTPMRWNGNGAPAIYVYATSRGEAVEPCPETIKPLDLCRELIRLYSDPGDLVIDPCAGSGSTLEAAYLEGRPAIGVDLSPAYCAGIVERMKRATAQLQMFGLGAS